MPPPCSYVVYDPATRDFTEDKREMTEQLEKAWPVHTYPWVIVTPDGGLVMSAGSTLVGGWWVVECASGGGLRGALRRWWRRWG